MAASLALADSALGVEEEDPLGLVEAVIGVVEREYVDPGLGSSAKWREAKKEARVGAVEEDASARAVASTLLKATGDAFTRLVDENARSLLESYTQSGKRGVVGLRLTKDGRVLAVDDPAKKAGVREDDVVLSVDGKKESMIDGLDGEPGTSVSLKIRRKDDEKTLTVQRVAPASTKNDSPFSKKKLKDVIIVRPGDAFSLKTAELLAQSLDDDDERIVLDLRGNGGGALEGGVTAAALFLEKGAPIATIKSRIPGTDRVSIEKRIADQRGPFANKKVFLLVDGNTASAAELFVAALRENNRAEVIGCCAQKTYGKARIQRAEPIGAGSSEENNLMLLLVSRALYETPLLQRDLSGTGITPDQIIDTPECCQTTSRLPPPDKCLPSSLLSSSSS